MCYFVLLNCAWALRRRKFFLVPVLRQYNVDGVRILPNFIFVKNNALNPEIIKQACGSAAFQRGMKYFESGKVLEVKVVTDLLGFAVTSLVAGSRGVYQQSVSIVDDESGKFGIVGLCSCPMIENCKHVAAVMLYALDAGMLEEESTSVSPIESWLDDLEKASRISESRFVDPFPGKSDFCVLYRLYPDFSSGSRLLKVQSLKVRILKRGGYGKPAAYPLEQIRGSYLEKFVQPVDKQVAQLLATSETYYYYKNDNSYLLQGELGELAFKKMLTSGRCHWEDRHSPALLPGDPRKIDFYWEETLEGQCLKNQVDPPVTSIFRVGLLWYIDVKNSRVGALDTGHLSPEQATSLLDAPPVPDNLLEDVSRRLLIDIPEYRLPTPVQVNIEQIRIEGEEPVFHIRLFSTDGISTIEGGGQFHCIQMTFGYGSVEIESFDYQVTAKLHMNNTVYTIERNIDAEMTAIDELYSKGLFLMDPDYSNNYEKLNWLFSSESIAHSAMQWHRFVETDLPQLQTQGWQVTIDDSFQFRFEEADDWHADLEEEEQNEWFSMTLGVELNGERINLLPALVDFLSQAGDPQTLREILEKHSHFLVSVGEHRWLKLPSDRLRPIFDTLIELYDHEPLDDTGKLLLSRHQGLQLGDLLNDPGLKWCGGEELQRLSARLRDFSGIESVTPPSGFNAELRPYQQQGLNWLQFMRSFEFNGILADDMGLGKTVQTLAHLLLEKQSGRMELPSLVIAPTSLMGNWLRESERFAGDLKVLVLHGADRHDHFDKITRNDIVLTTYPLIRRDQEKLLELRFHYIVLDESQFIKNPKSQTTQVIYKLKCSHRLCLTGTPMENHLGELWSMFHFLMPGFLGNLERFNRLFRNPIEKQGDSVRRTQLAQRVKPFLLRRTKQEVAAELPEKTEIIRTVTLQGKQRDLYETIRLAMDKKVRDEIKKKGVARSHIMILDALLKLRQVCCDPRLVALPQAKKVSQNAKLELLMEMLPEMVEEGRRILLFSQFAKMLGLIEVELEKQGIAYSKLTGQTRKRDEAISRFQEGDVPVFLISLKAGGVGLNLTAADIVIHYDPWWNPAVENQATDRAHRIGQDKAVFVYKLVTENTVEEKIIAMQQKKQALADAIYSGKSPENVKSLSGAELTDLLKPLE